MSLNNPNGAFGGDSTGNARGAVTQQLPLTTAVARGEAVAVDAGGTFIKGLTTTPATSVIGIAAEAAAAGKTGLVTTAGPVYGVAKEAGTAIDAGDPVTLSAATAGAVTVLADATGDAREVIGTALSDALAAATTVDIYVR